MNIITIPTLIIEMASISFFQPSTKRPQTPEKIAVIAMTTQRMFLISYLTESITDGSLGKA